jgi:hypothetical protein
MTQHQKIYEFAKDGAWHCQTEFWAVSHSPHKRRAEMSQNAQYQKDFLSTCRKFNIDHFEERDCIHGVDRANDYYIVRTNQVYPVFKAETQPITQFKVFLPPAFPPPKEKEKVAQNNLF